MAEGDRPVVGTPGYRDVESIYQSVFDALSITENRAVILSGWSDFQSLPLSENVLVMDAVPHDWLLPKCKVVIHHGGAGTTAAGLRSGIPNIVVSFAADQPFWGARVHAIGAGPKPVPVRKLTVENLIAAIIEADGETIRNVARAKGRAICTEDGVGQAIKLIDEYTAKWQASRSSTIF